MSRLVRNLRPVERRVVGAVCRAFQAHHAGAVIVVERPDVGARGDPAVVVESGVEVSIDDEPSDDHVRVVVLGRVSLVESEGIGNFRQICRPAHLVAVDSLEAARQLDHANVEPFVKSSGEGRHGRSLGRQRRAGKKPRQRRDLHRRRGGITVAGGVLQQRPVDVGIRSGNRAVERADRRVQHVGREAISVIDVNRRDQKQTAFQRLNHLTSAVVTQNLISAKIQGRAGAVTKHRHSSFPQQAGRRSPKRRFEKPTKCRSKSSAFPALSSTERIRGSAGFRCSDR